MVAGCTLTSDTEVQNGNSGSGLLPPSGCSEGYFNRWRITFPKPELGKIRGVHARCLNAYPAALVTFPAAHPA